MLILIKILLACFYDTLILNCDCEDANCSSDGSSPVTSLLFSTIHLRETDLWEPS